MNLSELKSSFLNELAEIYPKEEILSFYYLLVKHYLNLKKTDAFLKPDVDISQKKITCFNNAIQSLKKEKPIQYIIGTTEFYDLTFQVNEHVLIPRPETEELVDWILKDDRPQISDVRQEKPTTILDIGTGSGCIAISLAKNLPASNVFAIDISDDVLKTAAKNAENNTVNVQFSKLDILNFEKTQSNSAFQKYDIIVSNPPYVREFEKKEIQKNVLNNEPHLALFVDDENPLVFYDKITDLAKQYLSESGKIFLEINQYLASETVTLLKQKGFEMIELRKDLYGNKRMLKASVK